jgi:competence protein ComEA
MDDKRKLLEVAAWALAAFVAVFLGVRMLHRGSAEAAPVPVSGAPGAAAARAPAAARPKPRSMLVVDVEGEVRQPGLRRVPVGSRAGVAVDAAGGLTGRGDPTAVNLAAPLHDGQQIVVPRRGAAVAAGGAPAPAGGAGAGAPAGPISLSSATVAQLDTLDGIGPTLAQRIVQYREAHGGFRSVAELKQVEGIGEKRFASLSKAVQP